MAVLGILSTHALELAVGVDAWVRLSVCLSFCKFQVLDATVEYTGTIWFVLWHYYFTNTHPIHGMINIDIYHSIYNGVVVIYIYTFEESKLSFKQSRIRLVSEAFHIGLSRLLEGEKSGGIIWYADKGVLILCVFICTSYFSEWGEISWMFLKILAILFYTYVYVFVYIYKY